MSKSLRDYMWLNRSRLTVDEMARRLNIAPTYLSRVINGKSTPSINLAKKIEMETNGQVKWNELMEFCFEMSQSKKS